MRRTRILIWPLLAMLLGSGTAHAAPGDPHVVYTANSYATGAVVLRTDPASGSLVEISRNGPQGTLFERPYDLAVEADGNLVVADLGRPNQKDGAVIRVDPLTGAQRLVASGGEFYDPAGIAVAPDGRLYVVDNRAPDNDGAVVEVDPVTGAQRLVAEGGMLDLPFGIAVDRDGTLVVTNRTAPGGLGGCNPIGSVIRVDPASGHQERISRSGSPFDSLIAYPLGVALAGDGTILVANECDAAGAVVRIDPSRAPGSDQSELTSNGDSDVFRTPERIALDPAGDLLVTDFTLGDSDGGIVKVDVESGGQSVLRSGELFNHPLGIAAVVNRPPVASLSLEPATVAAGRPVRLDGSGSSDPERLRLSYEWDLDGDGSFEAGSGTTATATRSFSHHGPATVRMQVTDPHGSRSVAEGVVNVDGAIPVITRLRVGTHVLGVRRPSRGRGRGRRSQAAARERKRARRLPPSATKLAFTLSEPARVTLQLERARAGRRTRGGACRARGRRGPRCLIWPLARSVARDAPAGPSSMRLRARGLRPGRYRLLLSAADAVGNPSARRSLPLRVVRLRR
jgi:sugar lactone lactonase YvrE